MCLTVEFYDTVTGNVLHEQQVSSLPRKVTYEVPYVDELVGWWRWRKRRRFYLTSNPVSVRVRLHGKVLEDYGPRQWAVQGSITLHMPEDYLRLYTKNADGAWGEAE